MANPPEVNSTVAYVATPAAGPYGYVPSKGASTVFLALFCISTITHAVAAYRFRLRCMLWAMVWASILEVMRWSARAYSSSAPTAANPVAFSIQFVALLIAPDFLLAGIVVMFSRLTNGSWSCYRRLSPRRNLSVFISCISIAALAQLIGGIIGASNESKDLWQISHLVVFSSTALLALFTFIFTVIVSEFAARVWLSRPVHDKPVEGHHGPHGFKSKLMLCAVVFCVYLLLLRAAWFTWVYAGGWSFTTEIYTDIFDGMLVLLSLICLNVFHPGYLMAFQEAYVEMHSLTERGARRKGVAERNVVDAGPEAEQISEV